MKKRPSEHSPAARELSPEQRRKLLLILQARFAANQNRHDKLNWNAIKARLEANPDKLWSLQKMETTGGEPDTVGRDTKTGAFIFVDCSAESPKGRVNACYDLPALAARKEHKPKNNALDMAAAMGVEILTEEQYRDLQNLGEFDTKSSSWIKTPADIRKLGGALFGHRRFGRVFLGANGADSYFGSRGFRAWLKV